jgi:hypothetical protein
LSPSAQTDGPSERRRQPTERSRRSLHSHEMSRASPPPSQPSAPAMPWTGTLPLSGRRTGSRRPGSCSDLFALVPAHGISSRWQIFRRHPAPAGFAFADMDARRAECHLHPTPEPDHDPPELPACRIDEHSECGMPRQLRKSRPLLRFRLVWVTSTYFLLCRPLRGEHPRFARGFNSALGPQGAERATMRESAEQSTDSATARAELSGFSPGDLDTHR